MQASYRLATRIGHRMSRAAALMHRHFEARAGDLGVTRMTWTALASIGLEGVASPSALAAHMGVTRPAASRLLRQMERAGLLLRAPARGDGQPGDVDKRAVALALTEAGRAKLALVRPRAEETNRHFSAKLTGAELAELFRLLDKLAEGEADATRL